MMNDFTKEELQYIYNYIFNGAACISVGDHDDLKNKLKYMIDNYCDHDFQAGQHLFTDTYCTKCNLVKDDKCEHKWIECYYGEESIPINLCALCNLRERR